MNWSDGRMGCLDLETTAPDPLAARIVQAAFCLVGGGEPPELNTWIVDPAIEVPAEAAAIHGVTTARARAEGGLSLYGAALLDGFLRHARAEGWPVVLMNAPYDLTVLACELERAGLGGLQHGHILDVRVLDKQADAFVGFHRRGTRKLSDLCRHYDVRIDGAHDACHDAMAAARVAYRLAQKFPHQLGERSLAELQPLQARWYREAAEGLQAHWISKGDPRRIDSYDWPVRKALR